VLVLPWPVHSQTNPQAFPYLPGIQTWQWSPPKGWVQTHTPVSLAHAVPWPLHWQAWSQFVLYLPTTQLKH